jgi:hypothetical protein
MGERLPTFLPRIAVLVLGALAATAGLTFAAGQKLQAAPKTTAPATARRIETIVVPDVQNQAFVFAKGQLEDLGFAWKVDGSVHGYAANTVVSQSPPAGTKLINTGSPLVTLTLARNAKYAETGTPEDSSPYSPTAIRLADVAVAPVAPPTAKPKATAPAQAPAKTPAKTTVKHSAATAAAAPASRPPAFVVPGARKEPLDEMPLPERALKLGAWLAKHPKPTNASVKYWLYQNAWVVAGARMGWWHGADALRTLVAVDARTESLWGIGSKSRNIAEQALAEVEARTK